MVDLDHELRAVEDRIAIRDLVFRYAAVLDTPSRLASGEWETCFAEDVVLDYPWGYVEGRDGLNERARQVLAPNLAGQHLISNITLEIDGDVAHGRSNFLVTLVRKQDGDVVHFHQGGFYVQAFRRTDAGWCFTRSECHPMWRSPMIATALPATSS